MKLGGFGLTDDWFRYEKIQKGSKIFGFFFEEN